MDVQPRDLEEESKLLQHFVNDLVSVVALPAVWSGSEPSRIAHGLLDALLRMLQLDLIYIRLKETDGQAPVYAARFAQSQKQIADPLAMGKSFEAWLGADPQEWPPLIRKTLGDRDISIVPLGLGLQSEIGVIVAGSERADFPRQTERLILSIAANQASIALREARLLNEQKRVASELDRRVAKRTTELAAANDKLRNEIAERSEVEKRLLESEALLKESEARLWEVINTIPVIAWFSLPNGAYEFLNKRWTEYTGLSPEESTGSGWRVAYHPQDLPRLIERRQEYMSSGEPGEIQARIRRFDGVYRWFLIRAEPFRDDSSRIVRWYGTCTDIHDRKRAEEDFGSSEEKHRVILEAANDAVVSMDDHGVILLANPATRQMFGYDPVEIIGKPMTILMPEAMRKPHDTGYKRYLATGERHLNWHGVEVTALRKDGREFPVEVSFGEMTSEGHKIFTGFIRDISERKQAEDKLRANERELRLIINTMPTLAGTSRPDGSYGFFNQPWLDYTGLTAEQAQGSGWVAAIHPDDVEGLMGIWRASLVSGVPLEAEARLRRFDGATRWCLIRGNPLRDESGEIVRWYQTTIDIDDRKRAETALHAAMEERTCLAAFREEIGMALSRQEDLKGILHSCAGAMVGHLDAAFARIWTLSSDRRELKLQASAGLYTRLDGSHSRIAVGQLKIGLIAEERRPHFTNDVQNDPRVSDQDWARRETMTSFAGYPLVLEDRLVGVMGMFSRKPITEGTLEALSLAAGVIAQGIERKHAEEALRDTQAQLSRATRTATVGEFAAAIAHQINQPLAAVVTNGEACINWLAAEPPGLVKAHEAAARIVRDGKEAGEVVRRIRALFKKAPTEKIELDLNEVISEVLQLMTSETTKRRVAVEADLANDLPLVMADRVQLQQLVFNLLLNGIEAMDSILERQKNLFIRTLLKSSETILVEIRDSGVGLEDPEKAFEAFFTTKESGMGMGLAVCRSIVDSHHGRLWAESRGGEGTTFSFTLPVQTSVTS